MVSTFQRRDRLTGSVGLAVSSVTGFSQYLSYSRLLIVYCVISILFSCFHPLAPRSLSAQTNAASVCTQDRLTQCQCAKADGADRHSVSVFRLTEQTDTVSFYG